MKRAVLLLAVAGICAALSALPAHAQSFLGGGFLYDNNAERLGLDLRYIPDIKVIDNLSLVPNFDFLLANGAKFFRVDANAHYELLPFSKGGGVYALGGVDLGYITDPYHKAMTFGFNLGAGLRGNTDPVDIFGEAKYVVGGSFSGILVTGGLLFELK
jgi:hypothetical protein